MSWDEWRSEMCFLCANAAVWIASLAVCVVADVREYNVREYDRHLAASAAMDGPHGGEGVPVGFDYDIGAWTNSAGRYCAVGGQRPDKPHCGGDRTKED